MSAKAISNPFPEVDPYLATENKKSFLRAFLDFLILFFGISTKSNLSRTQGQPVRSRGLFLFRKRAHKP
jgi:hypothetical protein